MPSLAPTPTLRMPRVHVRLCFVLSTVGILSCRDQDEGLLADSGLFAADGEDDADGTAGSDGTGGTRPSPSDWEACSADDGHSTDLGEASITGDLLAAVVSYSGGCEEHRFALCWDQAFLESSPVQVRLDLIHTGTADPCEAYPSETLTFDLSPLRSAYAAAYGSETGLIAVNLVTRGGSATTTYSF